MKNRALSKVIEESKPSATAKTTTCPTCYKSFGRKAAENHISFCKEKAKHEAFKKPSQLVKYKTFQDSFEEMEAHVRKPSRLSVRKLNVAQVRSRIDSGLHDQSMRTSLRTTLKPFVVFKPESTQYSTYQSASKKLIDTVNNSPRRKENNLTFTQKFCGSCGSKFI